MSSRARVEILHGANLEALGRRDASHYGTLGFDQLEQQISEWARELDLETRFFQTNHEGELLDHILRIEDTADGILINAGAWTHYSWALRDALEVAALPTMEVHLSDIANREDFRKVSVFEGLPTLVATIMGKGPAGYREALIRLKEELA
ncbi:MAG TPA: type II 3-dehydroquinate dehydratase [Baekduia sp.]|nr:type II 3-dehydroquinate dehydratase [Baekduia sp.]